jgi:uncharacterized membrane protein
MKEAGHRNAWPGRTGSSVQGLLALTFVPCALLLARFIYTRSLTYSHVLWNLMLAWAPLPLAWLATRRSPQPAISRCLTGAGWLLFLPNAPYLITDLVHLRPTGQIPLLYDGVLLFSLGLAGLAVGITSVDWMERGVAGRLGQSMGRAFALASLAAAGFGVYVGRFLRWNSWDALIRPAALARELLGYAIHPIRHWQAWATAGLFALLLVSAYLPMVSFTGRSDCDTPG